MPRPSNQRVRHALQRWSLEAGQPFPQAAHNDVVPVEDPAGYSAVLKVAPPGDSLVNEIAALQVYGGNGAVQFLKSAPDASALLVEAATPGTPLADHPSPDESLEIAARAMRRLWYPDLDLSHPFPTLADWCGALDDRDSPIPEDIRARATDCFAELDATKECQFLLHGDFHHFNVLRATRDDWLVIDPKGVLGDPAYEPATFLRNHLEIHGGRPETHIATLAGLLDLDPNRIRDYAFVHCVLSATWSAQDGHDSWLPTLELAERFAR